MYVVNTAEGTFTVCNIKQPNKLIFADVYANQIYTVPHTYIMDVHTYTLSMS